MTLIQWNYNGLELKKGGCEMSNISIKGNKTIHLFNISVNLLKQYGNFKQIKFIDNRNFDCILPDNKVSKISLNKYYILFHRKTWYETKLNAIPKYSEDTESYNKIKELFNDPLRKPKYFNFKNDDLTKIFSPIFDSSKTWVEFLDNIYKLPDICQKIYPWYIDAIMYIKSPYKLPEEWIIIIDDKILEIKYERILLGSGKKKLPEYKGELTYYIPDPEEIRNFKYII